MTSKTNPRHKRSCSQLCLVLSLLVALLQAGLLQTSSRAQASSPWDQPATQLASQISEILGSGQAQLLLTNRSTIAAAEIAPIRHLLEQDLRQRGIAISGGDSANIIRVTLSENTRERLWVAEIVEGNRTDVTMVHVDRSPAAAPQAETGIVLEKKRIWSSTDPTDIADAPREQILAALDIPNGLVLLEPETILILSKTPTGWREEKRWNIDSHLTRDPRGLLRIAADENSFTAVTPGSVCDAKYAPALDAAIAHGEWTIRCHESDDPWPVETAAASTPIELHAFYNASRDFFTGVITAQDQGSNAYADPTPFYTIAALPRPAANRPALLIDSIDGKVKLLEQGSVHSVGGTRDWGNDFAAIHSACGAGTQIVTSSSGEAPADSLRAYELPAQEAIAVSPPIEMSGTVTALQTARDGQSIWAIVRKGANEYEVDRVTALCP